MVAAIALEAAATLKEMAHLGLIDAGRDPELNLAVGEDAVLT